MVPVEVAPVPTQTLDTLKESVVMSLVHVAPHPDTEVMVPPEADIDIRTSTSPAETEDVTVMVGLAVVTMFGLL